MSRSNTWKMRNARNRIPVNTYEAVPKSSNDVAPFRDDDRILETAIQVFRSRETLVRKANSIDENERAQANDLSQLVKQLTRNLHKGLALTPRSVCLAGLCKRLRLNRIEAECLMVLLLGKLGLMESRVNDIGDVVRVLCLPAAKSLAALRSLSESGRLFRKGVIFYSDPDEELGERTIILDPSIVQTVLEGKHQKSWAASLNREDDLRELLARLTRAMQKKSDELDTVIRGYGNQAEFQKWHRKQGWLLRQLDEVLKAKPTWKLSRARNAMNLLSEDWIILLALMGKTLCHVKPDDDLFSGAGLCRAICSTPADFSNQLERLRSNAPLLQENYIQPSGGYGGLVTESPESIQETEYELSGKTLKLFGLEQANRLAAKRDSALRTPCISLRDLALTPKTRQTVNLALDHARNAGTLMDTWGLRKAFPYGTGITMLFYGPPGTGKTATAEAIADELDKPLLVADYSKIQNCFVGQTEKNIMKIFREARQHSAVLFWDEADAMFFDRDKASHAWEVRDVNVLLQEIERFDGVCILATNRKMVLDKALERRITAKVEFPRPDRELREAIWRKMLPKQLPLAPDVNIARLSKADLSGGEIKNVILNASRFACSRSGNACVTGEDFEQALNMETDERWASNSCRRRIGFNS